MWKGGQTICHCTHPPPQCSPQETCTCEESWQLVSQSCHSPVVHRGPASDGQGETPCEPLKGLAAPQYNPKIWARHTHSPLQTPTHHLACRKAAGVTSLSALSTVPKQYAWLYYTYHGHTVNPQIRTWPIICAYVHINTCVIPTPPPHGIHMCAHTFLSPFLCKHFQSDISHPRNIHSEPLVLIAPLPHAIHIFFINTLAKTCIAHTLYIYIPS